MKRILDCWGRSKIDKCYMFRIKAYKEMLNLLKEYIRQIEEDRSNLRNLTKERNIISVLNFRAGLDKNYLKDIRERKLDIETYRKIDLYEIRPCKLEPDSCKLTLDSKVRVFEKLFRELETQVGKYQQEISIINRIQNYCRERNKKVMRRDSIFLKFSRNKLDELIVLCFDIDNFIRKKSITTTTESAFVFSGRGESQTNEETVLTICYYRFQNSVLNNDPFNKDVPEAVIDGFSSDNKRRGHGTFLLENLEDIIKEVNKKIITKANEPDIMQPIKLITGDVSPSGDIKYDDLMKLYKKHGFSSEGSKIYRVLS
ncbi:hypothetical protein PRVXT_001583 [Proteinivorax tanatarense]|uniref:Uncharacterized protein n=1 Tax=Proteinivorax tanatarense TaxID=1260629 RepID=A0AAU7VHI6_9FIRM